MSLSIPLRAVCGALLLGSLLGCQGKAKLTVDHLPIPSGDGTESPAPFVEPPPAPLPILVPRSGMRRLNRVEVDNTLHDLLGDTSHEALQLLPEDNGAIFDNDYTQQQASAVLVEAVDLLAQHATERALSNPAIKERLIPCVPQSAGDPDCLRKVITTFGRRALRRPLAEDEIQDFLSAADLATQANSFEVGVELVIRSLLSDMEFLYRVEVGTVSVTDPAVRELSAFEVASRLSFFLWGSTPPDWLLDLAEQNALSTRDEVRAAASKLLADDRAKARIERFHALWLNYTSLPYAPDLAQAMNEETRALVDKVVFDEPGDYFRLFTADQTFVNDLLAQHYGLPSPGATAGWISYAASGRRGILSHGTVLSNGAKQGDTSPTRRGLFIRQRLLCQEIPPPPPNVVVDNTGSTDTGTCKQQRYAAHAQVGSCATCHKFMDPVGFGLEQYDQEGRFRTTEAINTSCTISGDGVVEGVGSFNGPGQLGQLLVDSGSLEPCFVRQLFRFEQGRTESLEDEGLLQALTQSFSAGGRRLDQLLLDVVSDDTFRQRRED